MSSMVVNSEGREAERGGSERSQSQECALWVGLAGTWRVAAEEVVEKHGSDSLDVFEVDEWTRLLMRCDVVGRRER